MQVPYRVELDFELQVGPYETRVAATEEPDKAPIAIVIFKDFDEADVPRQCQSIFLKPEVALAIKMLVEQQQRDANVAAVAKDLAAIAPDASA